MLSSQSQKKIIYNFLSWKVYIHDIANAGQPGYCEHELSYDT